MEFNKDQEFEKNQTDSQEVTDHTNSEQPSTEPVDINGGEELIQAVDADFTINADEEEKNRESEQKLESIIEQTRESEQKSESIIEQTRESEQKSESTIEQTRSTSQMGKQKPAKKKFKSFASTVAAGVIGSVLTLAVLPHTDYLKNYYPAVENQASSGNETASQVRPVTAQPSAISANSIADMVEQVSKSIVGVVNYQQRQNNNFYGNSNNNSSQSVETGSGSGVIFQKNGNSAYIVTNNHVIEGASKLEVSLFNGEKTTAEVVGSDALTDLAVLKIDAKYVTNTAEFGDSTKLRPGDEVYAIGNPLGLEFSRSVTSGIISAMNRSISVSTSAGNWDTNVIQTDAAINPGNSGGALINTQGQVIGINSLKISENGVEGLGFAIPSSDFIPIVNQLIKSGKVDRPYLGVGLADLDQVPQVYWQDLPNDVTKGVLVMNIDPSSAAARAGLQSKDVIVSMNGTTIANSSELRKYLYTKTKIGDEIKFEVYRNGKLTSVTVKLTNNKTE